MRFQIILLAVINSLSWAGPAKGSGSSRKCSDLKLSGFSDFNILQSSAQEVRNYTSIWGNTFDFCNLTLTLRHHNADDTVITTIWLPLNGWNRRFVATGGSGLAAGTFDPGLAQPVAVGYAAGSTDAGLTLNGTVDPQLGTAILRPDGSFDTTLFENFAHRSIHEMTVIGKAAVKTFYGNKAQYSYYSGCSQGGRQGYTAAQKYPKDYDGIMANAPAIYSPRISPGNLWSYVLMQNTIAPPQCVFEAYERAIIQACDPLDGVRDGLISAPEKCRFDTDWLVNQKIFCDSTTGMVTITRAYARVVAGVLQGPVDENDNFLWYGNVPGAPFGTMASTTTDNTTGKTTANPFKASEVWIKYFVARDPALDASSLSFSAFTKLFHRSVELYSASIGTDDEDLRDFRKAGGKLLTWHGMADPAIPHSGTERFWNTLRKKSKSLSKVDDFYRVFLAPGAGHCYGGYGPVPTDPLAALAKWVEKGTEPKVLYSEAEVNGTLVSRNLCPYPRRLRYNGEGDVNLSESFSCA